MGIFQSLIEQSKLPNGRLGRMMLRIMNHAHNGLTLWGLSKLKPCQVVLDVSCGGGNAIHLMTEMNHFSHIFGIDFSPDAVSLTTDKNRKDIENGIVTVLQASVLELPFESNFFDAVTTFQSHYHWSDILASMQEIYRVLKPGGQFVLVAEVYKIKYHMKEYNSIEQTITLFEDSKFKDINLVSNIKYICVTGNK